MKKRVTRRPAGDLLDLEDTSSPPPRGGVGEGDVKKRVTRHPASDLLDLEDKSSPPHGEG